MLKLKISMETKEEGNELIYYANLKVVDEFSLPYNDPKTLNIFKPFMYNGDFITIEDVYNNITYTTQTLSQKPCIIDLFESKKEILKIKLNNNINDFNKLRKSINLIIKKIKEQYKDLH